MRYDSDSPFILQNISVEIEATEKVLTIYLLNYYIIRNIKKHSLS